MDGCKEVREQDIKLYRYNLPLRIDLCKAALIVVDMQNDFIHPEGVLAKQGFCVTDLTPFVKRVASLIDLCRKRSVPVIGTRHVIQEDGKGEAKAGGLWVEMRPFLKREGFRLGSWGVEFIEGLPAPDYVIDKPRFSAFYETNLECLFRGMKTETIIFSGVATNVCVESTIRDAFVRDFHVITIEDCVAAYSREAHEASLVTLDFLGAIISLHELNNLLSERRI